jgi:lysophospholipase L1-like esterase
MRRLIVALFLLCALPAAAQQRPIEGPGWNRIYGVGRDGTAQVPVPAVANWQWQVESLDGSRVVRAFAPAEPGNTVRVPAGGWYRLIRRQRDGMIAQVGNRFAAGYVVVVAGQSQAEGFFFHGQPETGAFRAEARDPAAPAVHAVVYDCAGQQGCGADGTAWGDAGENLGARVLLAELSQRLGGAPVALAGATWGGATAHQFADPRSDAGRRLRRVARAAAPASAVLILGHGATDAFFGTDPEGYRMAMAVVVQALRGAGGPQMPVAQALLGPLEARRGEREALLTRLGLAGVALQTRDPVLHAAMIRESQVLFAREVSLASGGDLSRVALGADGVHWSRDGVIQAARIVAEALAAELR